MTPENNWSYAHPLPLGSLQTSLWPLSSKAAPASTQAVRCCSRLPSKSPHICVVVWTDGAVSSRLGAGSASVQAVCGRCSFSSSLFYSPGPVSSSFSTESLAQVHCLEWCHSHLKLCHFQSALFLTDSQSALIVLSTISAFLQPKYYWDNKDLSNSLSFCVALSFQRVPSHAVFPNINCSLPTGLDHCKD